MTELSTTGDPSTGIAADRRDLREVPSVDRYELFSICVGVFFGLSGLLGFFGPSGCVGSFRPVGFIGAAGADVSGGLLWLGGF
ncbi:hypothetical protein Scani_61400 [Streptomyces caniferus]|uniref:Uncharacterized protein n=1 Tax=Streptomyces caniferus TaxID=285557 RepID=A0A640SH52_9ACTN|nr:hypothetical protein Scani_61400 [Streptomyces caniferus]